MFTATQNNAPVKGVFKKLAGTIHFDAEHINLSKVNVTVETDSINTSYQAIGDALKTEDWLNVTKYPNAIFKSIRLLKSTIRITKQLVN